MSEFETTVDSVANSVVAKMRRWEKEQAAKEIAREFLSEEGLNPEKGSKLSELLEERHRIALNSPDELIRLKAIDSALQMAAGSEKIVATQNNQFNFGEFLNKLKD